MSLETLLPWVPLGLLFLAPFFDPRRPFRLLHLDLLVLLCFAALYLRFYLPQAAPEGLGVGWETVALVMVALGLLYVTVRMLTVGFYRRDQSEPLVPYARVRWLAVAIVLLATFRVGYALIDEVEVADVGGASVIGADLIGDGREIYAGGELATEIDHGDTYGAFNYLAYLPFEQALPLEGPWDDASAARAAAIVFDLLTVLGLFALGTRLRTGGEGKILGLALAYAWVSYPYTLFVLRGGYNDSLVALLIVATLLAAASPIGRGALLALATAAKFGPVALAPLFATGVGRPSRRSVLLFGATFVAVLVVTFLPVMPDGGPREIYDRTIDYQDGHDDVTYCCSIWGGTTADIDWLHWLLTPSQVAAASLVLLVAFVPSGPRTPRQLAALAAAVIAAIQFAKPSWLPSYSVWFVPLVLVALFDRGEPAEIGMTGRDGNGPGRR